MLAVAECRHSHAAHSGSTSPDLSRVEYSGTTAIRQADRPIDLATPHADAPVPRVRPKAGAISVAERSGASIVPSRGNQAWIATGRPQATVFRLPLLKAVGHELHEKRSEGLRSTLSGGVAAMHVQLTQACRARVANDTSGAQVQNAYQVLLREAWPRRIGTALRAKPFLKTSKS